MVGFAGWSMPVQYGSIVEEHAAVRTKAGLFDVSHMGRIRFDGPQATAFLDRMLTRRVTDIPAGKIRYSLVTNEQGGILDDVLVYHLLEANGTPFNMLVVNASNREKLLAWFQQHGSDAPEIGLRDMTVETAMIAVQGPKALELVRPLVAADVTHAGYYSGIVTTIEDLPALVSRTGYTGEDGFELTLPASAAVAIWERLVEGGGAPAGLGARDTLRLEAAMPLYGHELSEQLNPYQANLGFAVQLAGRSFVGSAALAAAAAQPVAAKRVGLTLNGKRVPREHYPVLAGGVPVGEITSGTFSPTFQRPIAMAYVAPEQAQVGAELAVDIRGQMEPATVVKLPFYSRSS